MCDSLKLHLNLKHFRLLEPQRISVQPLLFHEYYYRPDFNPFFYKTAGFSMVRSEKNGEYIP